MFAISFNLNKTVFSDDRTRTRHQRVSYPTVYRVLFLLGRHYFLGKCFVVILHHALNVTLLLLYMLYTILFRRTVLARCTHIYHVKGWAIHVWRGKQLFHAYNCLQNWWKLGLKKTFFLRSITLFQNDSDHFEEKTLV